MTTVRIYRGLPGSGKSTAIKKWITEQGSKIRTKIFSADDFWIDPETNEYKFDPARIGEAHMRCFEDFLGTSICFSLGSIPLDYLIIDNTNIRSYEIAPYVMAANVSRFPCEIITLWADPIVAIKRNIHGVPPQVVLGMYSAMLEEKLPTFWKQSVLLEGST